MRKMACLLVWLLWSISAQGRIIYVSNVAGDDSFSGHHPQRMPDRTGPVRTITRALQLAENGDRILLEASGEPYRESVSLVGRRHSGQPHQPFTIEGNGAILDGSAPVPPAAWEHYRGRIFRFRPGRMAFQQLFLDGQPVSRVLGPRSSATPPKLEPLQWCLHEGRIYFCVEPGKLPRDYRLSCAHLQTGITLYHVRWVAIVDLTVQGFQLDGISACNSAREIYLGGVVCRGNGRSGISVGGASRVEIDRSAAADNGRAQLLTLPYSQTVLHDTQLLSNPAPAWLDRGGPVWIDGHRLEGGIHDRDVPQAAPRGKNK